MAVLILAVMQVFLLNTGIFAQTPPQQPALELRQVRSFGSGIETYAQIEQNGVSETVLTSAKTKHLIRVLAKAFDSHAIDPITQLIKNPLQQIGKIIRPTQNGGDTPSAGFEVTARPYIALTAEEVELRRNQIGKRSPLAEIHYELFPDGTPQRTFRVQQSLEFDLNDNEYTADQAPKIDLVGAHIEALTLNGNGIPFVYDGRQISINKRYFRTGANRLDIRFVGTHTNDGNGMVLSPNEEVIYTQGELYHAKKYVALFDQPDIKTQFRITVSSPDKYLVRSNGQLVDSRSEEGVTTWKFKETNPMSPYLLTIDAFLSESAFVDTKVIAYEGHELKLEIIAPTSKENILTRPIPGLGLNEQNKTLLDLIYAASEITLETMGQRTGIHYHEMWGQQLTQAFVNFFNWGGMENAGLINYTANVLYESQQITKNQFSWLLVLTCHEIAHMWLGNYVTGNWTRDLLAVHESDVEFLGYYLADVVLKNLHKHGMALDIESIWPAFVARLNGAITQSAAPGATHPVVVDYPDEDAAHAGFDSISYAGGAVTELMNLLALGDETFFQARAAYIALHGSGIATLEDRYNTLNKLGVPVPYPGYDGWDDFIKDWFFTSGVNTLVPSWEEAELKIMQFPGINRDGTENPTLRGRAISVGFYRLVDGRLVLADGKSQRINLERGKVETSLQVPDNVDTVLINNDGLSYAITDIDPRSLEVLKEKLYTIDNPGTRISVINSLHWMVKQAKAAPVDVAELLLNNLKYETNESVLEIGLQYLGSTLSFISDSQRPNYIQRYEDFAEQLFDTHQSNQLDLNDADLKAFRALSFKLLAQVSRSTDRLVGWLEEAPNGVAFGTSEKWAVIQRLAMLGATEPLVIDDYAKQNIQATMAEKQLPMPDHDSLIKLNLIKTSLPDTVAKRNLWLTLLGGEVGDLGNDWSKGTLVHHGWNDRELTDFLNTEYFEAFSSIVSLPEVRQDQIIRAYFPVHAPEDHLIEQIQNVLRTYPSIIPASKTFLNMQLKAAQQRLSSKVKYESL